MKEFAVDKKVVDTFSKVSLKRSPLPGIIMLNWCHNNYQYNNT